MSRVLLFVFIALFLAACQTAAPPTEPPTADFAVTQVEAELETRWNDETPVFIYWTGNATFPITIVQDFTECPPNHICDEAPFTIDKEANPIEIERSCWCTGAACDRIIETVSFYRLEDAEGRVTDTEPLRSICRP